jgi:hypothetical protein
MLWIIGELDSTEGMDHAKVIAHRIGSSGSKAPRVVYSSPFVRYLALNILEDLLRSKDFLTLALSFARLDVSIRPNLLLRI